MLVSKGGKASVLIHFVGDERDDAYQHLINTLTDSDVQCVSTPPSQIHNPPGHQPTTSVIALDIGREIPDSDWITYALANFPVILCSSVADSINTEEWSERGVSDIWSPVSGLSSAQVEASVWKAISNFQARQLAILNNTAETPPCRNLNPLVSAQDATVTPTSGDYIAERYQRLFIQAEQQTKELQLLDEVQNAIANQLDLDSLYDKIVDTVSTILGYKLVMITLLRDGKIWRGPYRGYINANVPRTITIAEGLVGEAAITGKPLLVKDVSKDERYYPISPGVLSNICIPFFDQEEVVGVLLIENQQKRLDERDLSFLTKVAEQISLAVENTRLHEKMFRELKRTEALYAISKSIQRTDDTEKMLQEIIRSTRDAVDSRWAIIYKFDYEKNCIEYISKTEHETTPLQALDFEQLQTGLTGWAIKNREVVLSTDIKADSRENSDVRTSGGELGSAIVAPLLKNGKPIGTLAVVNNADDPVFTEEDRELISTVANQSAVALTQHQLLKAIQHQAYHDSLTGLPNRTLLDIKLNQALRYAQLHSSQVAVVFVDLDGFKHINDTLGHSIGDTLLIEVAKRLDLETRSTATLARLGGDEFAVIQTGQQVSFTAINLGHRILKSLESEFEVSDNRLQIGASIGISCYPTDATGAQDLLRIADSAMYQAKAKGKNNVQVYSEHLAIQTQRRIQLENGLKSAIDHNELQLAYQPQYNLTDQTLVGFEALLRWRHPVLGSVPPDEFIPVAEDTGMILAIGEWVLRESCRQLHRWSIPGSAPIKMAINISSLQIESDNFEALVRSTIHQFQIKPSTLELEVTESVVMRDISTVIARLNALQQIGVQISVDDFGTGYSSLRYLQQLPLNALKIDRSFISRISSGDTHRTLIKTIAGLATGLSLRTVAEGVEDSEQLAFLKSIGCTEAQGYYFAKPLPADEAGELLSSFVPELPHLAA